MSAATGAPAGNSLADRAALRFAMLSVYYDSLRREGSLGGAPAILVPVQGGLLSLADALAVKKRGIGPMRTAVWRIVRATPVGDSYPSALAPALAQVDPSLKLDELDRGRKRYRAGANLLGAALVACAEGHPEFAALSAHVNSVNSDLDRATEAVLGITAGAFLRRLRDRRMACQLRKLHHEVGLDLYEYAAEFADAVAFDEWWEAGKRTGKGGAGKMTVYPASSVIQQDLRSMITRVTVTALVRCDDFWTLRTSADPQCWRRASDVLSDTEYVKGSYDLKSAPPIRAGEGYKSGEPPPHRWLYEKVNVPSSIDGPAASSFQNVLRIDKFSVVNRRNRRTVTVNFSLARSIDSTVLWDKRGGGILVDQGYIVIRHLNQDRWRLTSHKTLLFSNRTPNVSATGSFDLGQMLNLFAPVALSWWLDSETYGGDSRYSHP